MLYSESKKINNLEVTAFLFGGFPADCVDQRSIYKLVNISRRLDDRVVGDSDNVSFGATLVEPRVMS